MDFILRSSHTLSHVQNNKWPYGPARLGRLPVKEEIAGSNPVRVAIPGGAQQAWEQYNSMAECLAVNQAVKVRVLLGQRKGHPV